MYYIYMELFSIMKLLSRVIPLIIISCLMSFLPIFSMDLASIVREFNTLPPEEIDLAFDRWQKACQRVQNKNPSPWTSIGMTILNVIDAAQQVGMSARRKAIGAGLSEDEARSAEIQSWIKSAKAAGAVCGNGVQSFCQASKLNPLRSALQMALITTAVYGIKIGFDFAKEYYIMHLQRPRLLRFILAPHQISKNLDDLFYTGETDEQLKCVLQTVKGIVENKKTGLLYKINPFRDTSKDRARFENLMLWGPPGTGKTAIVEVLAKEAGMTLFATTGGDFAKLKGKDLQEIDELFESARASSRPVLLFIDEMEKLFGSRTNMSEDSRQVFTKLLAELSDQSNQIMLVGATNRPEDLDEAIYRRLSTQIQVAYPDQAGRINLFRLYKKLLFEKDAMYNKAQLEVINKIFCPEKIEQIERIMGKISPADIATVMSSIKNRSLAYNKGIPTEAIIDKVLLEKQKQFQTIKDGFKRIDTDIVTSKDTH